MEEIEVEIKLDTLPDVPRMVEGLAAYMDLEPETMGMTSTLDRLVDTEDLVLLSQDHSLRVRQKLENMYAGNEIRLTYKLPLRDHDRLLIRDEVKLKLAEPEYEDVLEMLSCMAGGFGGQKLDTVMLIEELAREANLGRKGARLNLSIDQCRYSLPGSDAEATEYVFEIESHGLPEEMVLKASDWVLKEIGGREAAQCKYARGMRKLGRL